MTANESITTATPVAPQPELLAQVTALCNELDELILLHDHYYQAVEPLFSDDDTEQPTHAKLSVFPAWLQKRETDVRGALYQLQEALRNNK